MAGAVSAHLPWSHPFVSMLGVVGLGVLGLGVVGLGVLGNPAEGR